MQVTEKKGLAGQLPDGLWGMTEWMEAVCDCWERITCTADPRPQEAWLPHHEETSGLSAPCSVCSFFSPHLVVRMVSSPLRCAIVFFLPFFTSSSSSSPSLSKFTHFLCLPLQSAFSRPSCSLRWCVTPTITTTTTPLSLGSLPCFLPNSPSLTSPLFIFHIRQSFPWSQLCKQ